MTLNFLDAYKVARRDALVAYRMWQNSFDEVEQLYDYLLMDPLPGPQIRSGQLTDAVASLQQFIARVANGHEPDLHMLAPDVNAWNSVKNRYSVWAGYRKLQAHAENYLDPTLRQGKTTGFSQLESRLRQGRITDDRAREAVLAYLNDFEKVSNLDVIAGFQAGLDVKSATFYLIGRNRVKPYTNFYWRTLDMRKCDHTSGTVLPTAWSEWRQIESLAGGVFDNMVCPVVINGRFHVVWCEASDDVATSQSQVKKGGFLPRSITQRSLCDAAPSKRPGNASTGHGASREICLYPVHSGRKQMRLFPSRRNYSPWRWMPQIRPKKN